jgi:signal transduction histidine kinase/ligand-binding sensor domain-containing protein/DNA-binding response OmpR family regulator
MRTLLFILLVGFALHQAVAEKELFQFSNLSVRDGLSQNSIIRVFQDSKDYMWFCTRDGLNRYDGTSFKVYRFSLTNPNSISSSDVTCISENDDGTFWIGTHNGLNYFDPFNETFTRFFHQPGDSSSISSSCIKHLLNDKSDNTWISTTHGLDLLEKKTGKFRRIYDRDAVTWIIERSNGNICFTSVRDGMFVYNPRTNHLINYPLPENDYIYCLFEDSRQQLWAGMWSNSLKKLNPETKRFEQVSLKTSDGRLFDREQIGYMVEYKPGVLMLATRKGLLMFDSRKELITQIIHSHNSDLKDEKIITLYQDKAGNIWAGSWNGGIDFHSRYSNYFSHFTPSLTGKPAPGTIYAIAEINKNIWLATDYGLIVYDRIKADYRHALPQLHGSSSEVRMIYKDENRLWISLYAGGLHIMNLSSGKIERTIQDFRYGYVKAMTKDEADNYWIACGTNDPFLMWNATGNKLLKNFPIKGSAKVFAPINVQDVLTDRGQTIWVGTRSDGLFRYNYRTSELEHFNASASSGALSSDHVSVLFRDSQRQLWVGTFGGGLCLYDDASGTFKTYSQKDGLLNDAVCGIVEDKDGSLWISTLEGISHFMPSTGEFYNYNADNGYPVQETVPRASTRLADNTIVVGGMNTFVLFNPDQIVKNPLIPNVVISKFRIWTDNVSEGEGVTETAYPPSSIRLKYFQSAFTISFSALNYVYPKNNRYSYMLEGFDKNWNLVRTERSATYTNIPPGKYVFRVKASNNDGVWNQEGVSLQIEIMPPPWKTWWAYTLYFLIFIAVLSGFIYYILNKQKLETDINIKQIEQRNQEQNHQMRVRLFTNFSHELRTPLTLIIGPLNEVLQRNELPTWLISKLGLMHKNAQRLLWLVNQLMDFRKLESGFMKLHVSQVDVNMFADDVVQSFRELATTKQLNLILDKSNGHTEVWFDTILMEKVLFNLLSNAFKHTSTGGTVKVNIRVLTNEELLSMGRFVAGTSGALLMDVADDGDGIEKDELEQIFEPFYQAHNHDGTNIYGTGIGLNLCKGIVELHSGSIWAESEPGQGSLFRVLLPLGNSHFPENALSVVKNNEPEQPAMVELPEQSAKPESLTTEEEMKRKESFTILIVEDNEDVRTYIRTLLITNYKIIEAEDCWIGCKKAKEFVPDLIISDVMTPRMTGFELCQTLKNDEVTNHIPIILLTALSGEEQVKEGLISLADDYIVKPFNPEILQLRVNNLISIRRKIRQSFNKNSVFANINTNLPSSDDKFISKVFEYIKQNIDNPELRIDSFSKNVGMSRVQFYRKIKSITGKTPSTLIMEIRMNAASELIKKTDLNINEISYQVGFNDSSYFGKCFKMYFGVTPSDYKA